MDTFVHTQQGPLIWFNTALWCSVLRHRAFGSWRLNLYFAAKVPYSDADVSLSYIFKPIDLQDIEIILLDGGVSPSISMRLARQTLFQIFRIYGGCNNTGTFKSSRSPSVPDASWFPTIWIVPVNRKKKKGRGGGGRDKNILALLMSFSVCPQVILMSTTTAHNNNKQQYTLVTSVLENRVRITLSGKHGVIIERLLADFVCGIETNCCLTDEGKYARTHSSPFTPLHNYIITYLSRSLAGDFDC